MDARARAAREIVVSGMAHSTMSGAVTDQALVARIRQGDTHAFEQLFHEHYESLLRYAFGMVRARDMAEEVVQEVFLALWARRAEWTVQTTVVAYLFGATHHRALNVLRTRKQDLRWTAVALDADAALPFVAESHATDEDAITDEMRGALTRAIEALPPRCRETYVLARQHGLPHEQIAQVMGVSIKTVQEQMGRALRMLRAALAPYFP